MKGKLVTSLIASVALGALVVTTTIVPTRPAEAIPVFDSTNYAQNILQAARALTQINNQIKSLQNEAAMIAGLAKQLGKLDFSALARLTGALQEIDRLMGRAQGIGYEIARLEQRFRQLFPDDFDHLLKSQDAVRSASARLKTVMDAFRHTMTVQARIVEDARADAETIRDLVDASQGAEGGLQAQQATNQLLALTAKQQIQLQTMLASQYRAEAMEQARRVQAESEAREATRKFLGSGRAYTPD